MSSADIVIIGGGIIGASIAYQLAVRGTSNVVVLEREVLAYGSSGRATGGIRQQFADELDIRFSQEGVHFYEQFTSEQKSMASSDGSQTGDRKGPTPTQPHSRPYTSNMPLGDEGRPHFHQYGYLFLVTTTESWLAMQRHVALQQSLGVPTQLLSPGEVKQRVPQLLVDDLQGASFCPTDGYSDPAAMARALMYEAQTRGVTLREHAPVVSITIEHGRVQAIQTPQETISTPLVINATGAYAAFVAQLVGISDLPVRPLRRQLYLTEPFEDLPADVPMVVELSSGFHFRRRDERVILTMPLPISEEEDRRNQQLAPDAFELIVDEPFWQQVKAAVERRCPALATARIARAWSGLYEMTPDEHPVLGKTEVEGFLCACGFSGHGFMHAPMAAKLLTELILEGTSRTLDIEQFSIERFRKGRLLETTRLL